MSYSIRYNSEENIVEVKFLGDLDMNKARKSLVDIFTMITEKQCMFLLTDLLDAKISLSIGDIYLLPRMVEEMGTRFNLNTRSVRRAIVTRQEGVMIFYEDVFFNRGYTARIFHDLEKAREWLLEGERKKAHS